MNKNKLLTAKEMIDDLLKRGNIEVNEHVAIQLMMAHEKNTIKEDLEEKLTAAQAMNENLAVMLELFYDYYSMGRNQFESKYKDKRHNVMNKNEQTAFNTLIEHQKLKEGK